MLRLALLSLLLLALIPTVHSQKTPDLTSIPFVRAPHDLGDLTGQMFPHVKLHSIDGDTLDITSLRGRPVLINFWTPRCSGCASGIQATDQLISKAQINSASKTGIVFLGVDMGGDPKEAVEYLAREHSPIRNFHDYGSLRMQLHMIPAPTMTILIDAHGRIVFSQWSIFQEEVRAAIVRLGPEYASFAPTMAGRKIWILLPSGDKVTVHELLRLVQANQTAYLEKQKKYVCRFDLVTLGHSDHNGPVPEVQQIEDVFVTEEHGLESQPADAASAAQPDSDATAASKTIAVWSNPVFQALLDHSIISNISAHGRPDVVATKSRESGQISTGDGQRHHYVRMTIRGDPFFKPKSEIERVAQSIQGEITIDVTDLSFTRIYGVTGYNVMEGQHILVKRKSSIVSYRTAPFHGVNLPFSWTNVSFQESGNGGTGASRLIDADSYSVYFRDYCREFYGTVKVLPDVEPAPSAPPQH